MKASHAPPPILFRGRTWASDEIAGMAGSWRSALAGRTPGGLTAMVMANRPEAIALFFALSAGDDAVILLPPDPKSWRTDPPVPSGTRLVLPPDLAHVAPEAERAGLRATVLPPAGHDPRAIAGALLTCPGLVFFTSGSTGLPRPVYRRTETVPRASTALTRAIGFPATGGVIGVLPLDRSYGMNACLMAATVLARPLALLERFDHHALLALFATGDYHLWAGSPVMADVLSRSPAAGPRLAPRACIFAGRLPAPVCRAFAARFGVELRQIYGTTEMLTVTADVGPDPPHADTAGPPLPGVSLHVGNAPGLATPAGETGRIWVSTPWPMEGYGFPPALRSDIVDGWWPSPDVGRVDAAGVLTLSGRVDDCIRTGAGQLVNPAEVAAVLEAVEGVTDVAVVPVEAGAGAVLGAVVQSDRPIDGGRLRRALADALPAWAQPRVLEVVGALPRLASGRTDRRACIALLERAAGAPPR